MSMSAACEDDACDICRATHAAATLPETAGAQTSRPYTTPRTPRLAIEPSAHWTAPCPSRPLRARPPGRHHPQAEARPAPQCWQWRPRPRAQGREAMAGAAAALDMGPKERAQYLRRRVGVEPLGGPEEEASTLAGPTPGALRTWLRQVHDCAELKGLCLCSPPFERPWRGLQTRHRPLPSARTATAPLWPPGAPWAGPIFAMAGKLVRSSRLHRFLIRQLFEQAGCKLRCITIPSFQVCI